LFLKNEDVATSVSIQRLIAALILSEVEMFDKNPPAGFESHWDAAWFRQKADECFRIAGLLGDANQQSTMLDIANDLKRQSDHAALLAAIAFGGKTP
jgi:hypothetical protein